MSSSGKYNNSEKSSFVQKNIRLLNSSSIKLTDPAILKELEGIDIDKLKADRERNRLKLEKEQKELEQLKEDYMKYTSKTKDRESELRSHILNLSSKIRIRDVEQVKSSIKDLHSQILDNINDIQNKVRHEISEKKKDIENRINIRLMDSEYRHQIVLDEKVKEHENVLKSYHKYTEEMIKIKSNFENIKEKCNKFEKENEELKKNIEELEKKNQKYKLDLMNLKKINNNVKNELNLKKGEPEGNGNMSPNNSIGAFNTNTSHMFNKKKSLQSQHGLSIKDKGLRTSSYFRSNFTVEKDKEVDIEQTVKELLTDKNFYKQNENSGKAFAALLDILDNSKIKLNKLRKEYKELVENKTALQVAVEKIIKTLKNKTISDFTKSKSEFSIYLSKDDRKKFIELIMTDEEILKIFHDETLPTINIIDRKIKMDR